jgi:predicted permease
MNHLLVDVRQALRYWRARPGLVAVVGATLAIGAGANVVVFGLVESLILRPLPAVPSAERVLASRRNPLSFQAFSALAQRQRSFETTAAWQSLAVAASTSGGTESIEAVVVSGRYFEVLRVGSQRGRVLSPADETPGDRLVAVITDGCWRRRFSASPAIIGRTVRIDTTTATIVGVLAPGFDGTELGTRVELFLPVTAFDAVRGATGRSAWLPEPGRRWLRFAGRLRQGVNPGSASTEAERLVRDIFSGRPSAPADSMDLMPLNELAFPAHARASAHHVLAVLLVVGACVLLVACANVSNLLLAAGERRRREMAVRSALGASRSRLFSQMAIETLVLVAAATAAALLVGRWSLTLLSSVRLTAGVPIALAGRFDVRVAAAAAAAAALAALACGAVPAWRATRTDVASQIGDSACARTGWRRSRLRDVLVAAQVAVSVPLVLGAVVFAATLRNEERLPPGFRPDGVAMIAVNVRPAGHAPTAGADFFRRLRERAATLPGVEAVGMAINEPLGPSAYVRSIGLPGDASGQRVMNSVVSAGYFRAIGLAIVEGRDFDGITEPGAVVVNQSLARRLWPGRSAVGQAIEPRDRGSRLSRVIGVASDSKYLSLDETPEPFLYTHSADDYDPTQVLFVRTAGDARALLPALRKAAEAADPLVPVLRATTLSEHVAATLAQPRATARVVTVMALLAAALAAIGLHAVLALVVASSRREVAIRRALGCRPRHVVVALAGRPALAVLIGLTVGLASATLLGRSVASLLYRVRPTDPSVQILVVALVAVTGAVAAANPLLRALRVAPAQALRD